MNPRVCVRAHHHEQSSLRQLFELLRDEHVPRCRTSGTSCSAIGEQQEKQEATRRSRSRCTPPYGRLRLMHRLSSSAATVATDGQSDGHPARGEALGCPRDGWGGRGHRYKLTTRRTRKVKLANRAALALSPIGLLTCCSDRRCECMLFRKSEHTSREGSRRRRTLHGIATGPSTGTVPRYGPVPIEGAATIACAVEEQCAPPAERIRQRPQHGCTTVADRARRRAHCAGVLLLVKEQRAAALTRMPVHDWCMHHVLTSVPFTAGTQSQQMIGYYAIATAETA